MEKRMGEARRVQINRGWQAGGYLCYQQGQPLFAALH